MREVDPTVVGPNGAGKGTLLNAIAGAPRLCGWSASPDDLLARSDFGELLLWQVRR